MGQVVVFGLLDFCGNARGSCVRAPLTAWRGEVSLRAPRNTTSQRASRLKLPGALRKGLKQPLVSFQQQEDLHTPMHTPSRLHPAGSRVWGPGFRFGFRV